MQYEKSQELFYKRLSTLREQKGISARNMSLSIGQCESYINSIENKKILPSMSAFFYMCEYLDISPQDFFNDSKVYPTEMEEFIQELQKLSKEEFEHLFFLLKAITNRK
ncbi:MAG: helix-turn-helix transcriptional regulator [Lachnospiraceae bacterium]|nr:helix-turn-helix transcriptional regulator [Lachnospiraceae bacterium]